MFFLINVNNVTLAPFSGFMLLHLDIHYLPPNLPLSLISTLSHYWTNSCCQNCLLCSTIYTIVSFIIHKPSAFCF